MSIIVLIYFIKYLLNQSNFMLNLNQTITLKGTYCDLCGESNFFEHDNGFYVCADCGVQTKISHSVMLQYNENEFKGPRWKVKIKTEEEEMMAETTFASGIGWTSNQSEYSESEMSSRKSVVTIQKMNIVKELLKRYQESYLKTISLDMFLEEENKKKLDSSNKFNLIKFKQLISKLENPKVEKQTDMMIDEDDEYSQMKRANVHFSNSSLMINYNKDYRRLSDLKTDFLDFKENKDIRSHFNYFVNLMKITWCEFLSEEIDFSLKKHKNSIIKHYKRPKIRSRRNTEEETEKNQKKKRRTIIDQCNKLNIDHKRILELEDYRNSKLPNKVKYSKFLEEYSLVQKNLKVKNNLSLKIIFSLGRHFKLNISYNDSFEEAIHKFFSIRKLDYNTYYSEPIDEANKTLLTSDNLIAMKYVISNSLSFADDFDGLLFCEICDNFKSFDILDFNKNFTCQTQSNIVNIGMKKVNIFDLKVMKYLSKEKMYACIDSNFDKLSSKNILLKKMLLKSNINKICRLICIPEEIAILSNKIYYLLHKEDYILNMHNNENIQFGIVIYVFKLIYGLNDLPYLVGLVEYKRYIEDSLILKYLNRVEKYSHLDSIHNIVSKLPNLSSIFKQMSQNIRQKENNLILWDKLDFKKPLSTEYKKKYIAFNREILFEERSNLGIPKKINSIIDFKNKYHKKEIAQLKQNEIVKINNKLINNEHPSRQLEKLNSDEFNYFVKEEIEFYNKLDDRLNLNNKAVDLPLPSETVFKLMKKGYNYDANYFEAEMILFILIKKYFKIEYKVLKDMMYMVENACDRLFRSSKK